MTTSSGESDSSQQSEEAAGYVDDSQLPEDLRPDAEGLTSEDRVGGGPDGDNAAEPMGKPPSRRDNLHKCRRQRPPTASPACPNRPADATPTPAARAANDPTR